jgi:hypothetical protein
MATTSSSIPDRIFDLALKYLSDSVQLKEGAWQRNENKIEHILELGHYYIEEIADNYFSLKYFCEVTCQTYFVTAFNGAK